MEHRDRHWNQMSLRDGLHATHHLPLRDRVDGVDVEHPASPSWLPRCTVSTRRLPRLRVLHAQRAGCGRLPCRAGYKCETEMPASRTDSFFPNTSCSRCITRRIAGPDRSSCAASTPASRAMSAAVYLRGKLAPTSWFALDTPGLHPASDPSRQLRSAQSGHLC